VWLNSGRAGARDPPLVIKGFACRKDVGFALDITWASRITAHQARWAKLVGCGGRERSASLRWGAVHTLAILIPRMAIIVRIDADF